MMCKYICLIALILNSYFLIGQIDSIKKDSISLKGNIISPDYDSVSKAIYPPIDITVHYFQNSLGKMISKDNNEFYEISFFANGSIKSRTKVEVYISSDTSRVEGNFENDSVPRIHIFHNWRYRRNGKYKEWYSNNTIHIIGHYKWGLKHGTWKFYDEKRKVIKKEKWKLGVLKE